MIPLKDIPAPLGQAVSELIIRAWPIAQGKPAGRRARAALKGALEQLLAISNAAAPKPDAEALVTAYIAAGGDWHALVSAVNSHACEGSQHLTNRGGME